MRIYNTNEKYGFAGPFEAESFDTLADGMMPTLREWAQDEIDRYRDQVYHGEADPGNEPDINSTIDILREEFIAGLEEAPEC